MIVLLHLARTWSAETAAPWPPGIVDFAGRIARNHWYLFGPEKRADLEAINRELREAQQQLDKATMTKTRRAATGRGTAAAGRLARTSKGLPATDPRGPDCRAPGAHAGRAV